METIEYRFQDKTAWGSGPWASEPDKKQWSDPETGLPCLIVRNPMGALCGYVGVPEGHPAFGLHYSQWGWDDALNAPKSLTQIEKGIDEISVHGGLTFANACAEGEPEHGICHKPGSGDADNIWWFGFDCSHSGDLNPSSRAHSVTRIFFEGLGGSEVYRDQAYVEAECASLAKQLAELARAA